MNTNHETSLVRWMLESTIRQAWRAVIAVVGITIILLGVVMIFAPGPATVLIPMGLGILAIEFLWARRMLRRIKIQMRWKLRQLKQSTALQSGPVESNKTTYRETTVTQKIESPMKLHTDHRRWKSETLMWRDDIAFWQQEYEGALKALEYSIALLKQDNEALLDHVAAIEKLESSFDYHEKHLAESLQGNPDSNSDLR